MSSLREIFERLFKNDNSLKNKKNIQNLFIVFFIGLILLFVGGFFEDKKTNTSPISKTDAEFVNKETNSDEYDKLLETKIKNILSQIAGVGKVSIAITYSSSKEIVPAQDVRVNDSNTNEKDREGGVRNTVSADTDSKIILGNQNDAAPVILKEIPPQIRGVIVVADGAKDENIKVNISRAVSTALGIPLSRVQVFPMAN